MERSCPDCGAETEYAESTTRVLRGTCGACGHAFTVVADDHPVSTGPAPVVGGAGETSGSGATASAVTVEGLECDDCGGPLTVRASSPDRLEVACAECDTTVGYVVAGSESAEERRPYPPRGAGRARPDTDRGPPRARPCRECGGPLRFSTDDEGNVTGECTSCGNRFTLPPRRGDGPGPRGGGGRRPYSDRGRGGGGWRDRGGGDRRRSFRGPPKSYRRDDRGDGDERRRRRPRRE